MSFDGTATQKLWLCRWGLQTALVWAQTAETAELRVRHGNFKRRASLSDVTSKPQIIHGEVLVREATDADKETFEVAGGMIPA